MLTYYYKKKYAIKFLHVAASTFAQLLEILNNIEYLFICREQYKYFNVHLKFLPMNIIKELIVKHNLVVE